MHGASRGRQQVRHRLCARPASASAASASANTISSSHSGAGEWRGTEGLQVVQQGEEGRAQRTAGGGRPPRPRSCFPSRGCCRLVTASSPLVVADVGEQAVERRRDVLLECSHWGKHRSQGHHLGGGGEVQ